MCLHITPCSSFIVLCQNKVGTDIPIGNICKIRSKLSGKRKEPPGKESDNFSVPSVAPDSAEDKQWSFFPSFCQPDESSKCFLTLLDFF